MQVNIYPGYNPEPQNVPYQTNHYDPHSAPPGTFVGTAQPIETVTPSSEKTIIQIHRGKTFKNHFHIC